MLVEAKCDKEMLIDFMPEATSQAITLSEVTRCMFNFFTFGVLITMYLVIALFGIVCLMVPNGCFRHTPVMPRETTSHMCQNLSLVSSVVGKHLGCPRCTVIGTQCVKTDT